MSTPLDSSLGTTTPLLPEINASGVSWAAILAGATAAAILSVLLVMLGFGLGLSAVSPWTTSAAAIGTSTIAWLAFTQLAASGMGGYLAGRLRVKWASLHTDEVYFRDTAHGFLAWGVSTLVVMTLLGSVVSSILGTAVDIGTGVAGAATTTATAASISASKDKDTNSPIEKSMNYFSDMLMRSSDQTTPPNTNPAATAPANENASREINRIFAINLTAGKLSADDRTYLAQIVAKRTGLSQTDAESRVDAIYARLTQTIADTNEAAKQKADQVRKVSAHSALWLFVALLIGAFIASLSATFGGMQRDRARVR